MAVNSVVTALAGIASGLFGGIVAQSLSDWHSSWHGYYESWDPRLHELAATGDYGADDPRTGRALTLGGSYNADGSGRMIFSMQDPDYHAYQGVEGAKDLERDGVDYSAVGHPIPEASPGILFAGGLAGLLLAAGIARRG